MPDTIDDLAVRYGVGTTAIRALAEALRQGGGRMAQFNHPDLGGTGQWSAGGMIMIEDMSNIELKAKVDALCKSIAASPGPVPAAAEDQPDQTRDWWPAEFGEPSAGGGQNEVRYACFPDKHRVAVMRDGKVRLYDTGDHRISGVSQLQNAGQTIIFTSQNGSVPLESLTEI